MYKRQVDSSTITLTGDTLSVTSGGIDTTQLAAGAVTEAKVERPYFFLHQKAPRVLRFPLALFLD